MPASLGAWPWHVRGHCCWHLFLLRSFSSFIRWLRCLRCCYSVFPSFPLSIRGQGWGIATALKIIWRPQHLMIWDKTNSVDFWSMQGKSSNLVVRLVVPLSSLVLGYDEVNDAFVRLFPASTDADSDHLPSFLPPPSFLCLFCPSERMTVRGTSQLCRFIVKINPTHIQKPKFHHPNPYFNTSHKKCM